MIRPALLSLTETEMNMNEREAEDEIFHLLKKADLYLQAGSIEEYNRIQTTISELQQKHGAVVGIERKPDNDRTA